MKHPAGLPCPACGGVGMMWPNHPHAFGHKDFSRIRCRKLKKCGKTFDRDKYDVWLAAKEKKA